MEPWFETFAHATFQHSGETAHDLKTPLNIAVLNLELMRMRVRALVGAEDTRLEGYGRALESELRRLAGIFDAFFVLSTPPRAEGEPSLIDICPLLANAATEAKIDNLLGLKENVVMGHLIPAGTGLKKYKNLILSVEETAAEAPKEQVEVQI